MVAYVSKSKSSVEVLILIVGTFRLKDKVLPKGRHIMDSQTQAISTFIETIVSVKKYPWTTGI